LIRDHKGLGCFGQEEQAITHNAFRISIQNLIHFHPVFMQFTNHISKDEFESLGPAVFFTNPSPLFSDQDIDFEEVEQ